MTTEGLSRLELLARAADLSQRAYEGNELVKQRRFQEACANWEPYDETTQNGIEIEDAANQIPVFDYFTQFPLDLKDAEGNDDVVVLSDGKCYSRQNMRTFLQTGTVSLQTGRANFPETGQPLSDLDYALIGLESPSFDTEANRAARERTGWVAFDQLTTEATGEQRALEERLRQERIQQLAPDEREEAERRLAERRELLNREQARVLPRRLFADSDSAERLEMFNRRQRSPENRNALYGRVAERLSQVDGERYSLHDFLTWFDNETAQAAPLFRYDVETNGRMLKNLSNLVNPNLDLSIDPIGAILDSLPAAYVGDFGREDVATFGSFPLFVLAQVYQEGAGSIFRRFEFSDKNWLERRPELFVLDEDGGVMAYVVYLAYSEAQRHDRWLISTRLPSSLIQFVYDRALTDEAADLLSNAIVERYLQELQQDLSIQYSPAYSPETLATARAELNRAVQNARSRRIQSRRAQSRPSVDRRVPRRQGRQQQRSSRIAGRINPI